MELFILVGGGGIIKGQEKAFEKNPNLNNWNINTNLGRSHIFDFSLKLNTSALENKRKRNYGKMLNR